MLGATFPALSTRSHALVALLFFAASAAFTVWRNTQVGVLIDIAYPLNTATRIAAGDVPYVDFPLAHAPLHFLFQAALIKIVGPSFAVQIAYAAIFSGIATALTYWIAGRLLDGVVPRPRLLAALLSLPLVPLGVYSIYPHPFYDPDACLAVLAALAAILAARADPTPRRWILVGALLTIPVLIKQNIGGAFLVLSVSALAVEALFRPAARPGLRWGIAGLAAALGIEVLAIQVVIGVDHFLRWTLSYAMEGRGLSLERIAAFADPRIVWLAPLLVAPALASRLVRPRVRAAAYVALLCLPAAATLLYSVILAVPELFPPVLLAASAVAIVRMMRAGPSFETALPIVLLGTTLGALMSQGLAGSTFGIFPLLVLAVASLVREVGRSLPAGSIVAAMTGAVLSVMLLVSGAAYTLSEDRLEFIDVRAAGPVMRSTYPTLAGLSARGPYLAELDEILRWTEANVPPEDPMAFLPGEDPVFYALSRRPRLPSVYFFDVANPVSFEEIVRSADEVGLRWVFVKERIQMTVAPPLNDAYAAALTRGATLFAEVGPYRVYRRP